MLVSRIQWVELGYGIFAHSGPHALKVERLAKKMGVSKSSFYHHFPEQILFIEALMEMHLKNAKMIAKKENEAKTIHPELVNILIEHKVDLLFNRQLRFLKSEKIFFKTLIASNNIVGDGFIHLWLRATKLPLTINQATGLLSLALENFYLQINNETLTVEWLSNYFNHLENVAKQFV